MGRIVFENNDWILKDASRYDLSSDLIDLTDGSWTLEDPDSLVDSVSYSGGYNTVTWNTLAAGSNDYVWTVGNNHRSPRWYKLLKIDGNQVTSDDIVSCHLLGRMDTTIADFNNQFVFGVCTDPTSTVAATIDGSGGVIRKTTTGDPQFGVWTENAQSVNAANANNERLTGIVHRGARAMAGGVMAAIEPTNIANSARSISRIQNEVLASTVNQYLMVGVGTASGTITVTAGDQQRFSIKMLPFTHNFAL
jgi:hypothetical protein